MAGKLRRAFAALAVAVLACAADAGVAEPELSDAYPGMDDPAFVAARDLWLEGGEDEALSALASLARDGVTAAQVLLALIDKTAALQGPWLAQATRAGRVAVLRAPGPFSGRSWMHAAAEDSPAAMRWLRLWSVDASASLGLEFIAAGEARGGREAMIAASARQHGGFAKLVESADFPDAMSYLVWREVPGWGIEDLHPGDPQRGMAGAEPGPEQRAAWLMQVPETILPRSVCELQCGETANSCTMAANDALGSYPALMTLGTPSELLIPADVFAHSPRGQAALLRRILLQQDARSRRAVLDAAEAADACFGALLRSEAERYRPTLPPPNGTAPAD